MDQARKTVRQIREVQPTITKFIIGICVAVFIYGQATGTDLSYEYGLAGIAVTEFDQYYRFITAMFLHAGIIHILFNMMILWQIGSVIEMRIGSPRFIALYALSGLGGGLASFLLNDPYTVSVGASGAIFGLLGAYVVLARRLNVNHSQVLGLIGINLVLGFVMPGIDWHAHLGGLAVGAASAALLARH